MFKNLLKEIGKIIKVTKKHCKFCDGSKDLNKVTEDTIYGSTYYFHDSCLLDILCEPENHGHESVDLALTIEIIKNYELIKENAREKTRKRKLKKAQERVCNYEDT